MNKMLSFTHSGYVSIVEDFVKLRLMHAIKILKCFLSLDVLPSSKIPTFLQLLPETSKIMYRKCKNAFGTLFIRQNFILVFVFLIFKNSSKSFFFQINKKYITNLPFLSNLSIKDLHLFNEYYFNETFFHDCFLNWPVDVIALLFCVGFNRIQLLADTLR